MTISCFDGVENTVGIGENDDYQHSLLITECFPKPSSFDLCGKELILYRQSLSLSTLREKPFGKHCGKRKKMLETSIVIPFPQCF